MRCRYKEGDYGANAGLKVARDLLEPIKVKFPWISYADLWTLAGATAIEEMGGACWAGLCAQFCAVGCKHSGQTVL
jgi:catalase (peroxidase I)